MDQHYPRRGEVADGRGKQSQRKGETLMHLSVLIAIILLIVTLMGIFSYKVNVTYQTFGGFVAAIAALLLFLMAIGVIHL
jgi:uncharacterized Tic20 family protein